MRLSSDRPLLLLLLLLHLYGKIRVTINAGPSGVGTSIS